MTKITIDTFEIKASSHALSSFVLYQITLPAGGLIHRRYSEFVWLKKSLNRAVPGAVVPPLPPDNGGKGNVDMSFINERRVGLAGFLNAVQAHEELGEISCFRTFLTAPDLAGGIVELEASLEATAEAQSEEAVTAAASKAEEESGKGNEWSRYGSSGAAVDDDAKKAAAEPPKKSSWFSLPASLSASLPSFSAPSPNPIVAEVTPADGKMAEISAKAKELEGLTLDSFNALHCLTGARVEQCSEKVRWTETLVTDKSQNTEQEGATTGAVSADTGAGAAAASAAESGAAEPGAAEAEGLSTAQPALLPQGVAEGVSAHMAFFGQSRQQAVVAVAWQEHGILIKLLSERLLELGSVKDALAAREAVRKDLTSARVEAALRSEQLEGAVVKEGAARAKAAQGKGGKDADKLDALSFSRTKDKEDAQGAKAKADATVSLTKSKLNEATERMKREWARVNESWGVQCKAALLETAYANDRLHQIPVAALQALHDTISREQAEERASAALEAEQAEGAAAAAVEERRQAAEAKAAELEATKVARLAADEEAKAATAAKTAEEEAAATAKAEAEAATKAEEEAKAAEAAKAADEEAAATAKAEAEAAAKAEEEAKAAEAANAAEEEAAAEAKAEEEAAAPKFEAESKAAAEAEAKAEATATAEAEARAAEEETAAEAKAEADAAATKAEAEVKAAEAAKAAEEEAAATAKAEAEAAATKAEAEVKASEAAKAAEEEAAATAKAEVEAAAAKAEAEAESC